MLRAFTALALMLATVTRAAAAPPLAVIAVDPAGDVDAARSAARAAGFEPVVVELPTVDETAILDETEVSLARAHAAWLAQDYAAMTGVLDGIEATALPVLARPEHAAVLWQLAFLRGLAALSRGTPDAARWFVFAIELDAARRPAPGTYPPSLDEAFALANEEVGRRVARAITLRITPADARIAIDGVPVVDRARSRLLRRGLHAVVAEAPGYAPTARLIDVDAATIELDLVRMPGMAPAAALAPLAARGQLDLDGPSATTVVHDAIAATGATLGLLIGAHNARLVRPDGLGVSQPDAATALALAMPPTAPPPASRRRWWLWGGVGAVALGAVAVTAAVLLRDDPIDRTQIGF